MLLVKVKEVADGPLILRQLCRIGNVRELIHYMLALVIKTICSVMAELNVLLLSSWQDVCSCCCVYPHGCVIVNSACEVALSPHKRRS